MKSLFEIDDSTQGQLIRINPEALGIKVYRDIWKRDKSISKEKALIELSYVYFMCDYKSYFSDIKDEEIKAQEIGAVLLNDKNYKPDKLILDAIEQYRKDIPLSVKILEDAKIGIDSLRKYFREVDLMETDEKTGKIIHDAAKFNNNLKSLGQLLENLKKLEEAVRRDTELSSNIRGGGEKGMYEDPE